MIAFNLNFENISSLFFKISLLEQYFSKSHKALLVKFFVQVGLKKLIGGTFL